MRTTTYRQITKGALVLMLLALPTASLQANNCEGIEVTGIRIQPSAAQKLGVHLEVPYNGTTNSHQIILCNLDGTLNAISAGYCRSLQSQLTVAMVSNLGVTIGFFDDVQGHYGPQSCAEWGTEMQWLENVSDILRVVIVTDEPVTN